MAVETGVGPTAREKHRRERQGQEAATADEQRRLASFGLCAAGSAVYGAGRTLWANWSAVAHWYTVVTWYDGVVHAITPGTVAAALHLVLVHWRLLPSPRAGGLWRASVPLITLALGATIGVLWELYEWFARSVLGESIRVGYQDTLVALGVGIAGSLLAGLGIAAWAARSTGKDI